MPVFGIFDGDMFYLLGVVIIASGAILLMGLASRNPPPQSEGSRSESEP